MGLADGEGVGCQVEAQLQPLPQKLPLLVGLGGVGHSTHGDWPLCDQFCQMVGGGVKMGPSVGLGLVQLGPLGLLEQLDGLHLVLGQLGLDLGEDLVNGVLGGGLLERLSEILQFCLHLLLVCLNHLQHCSCEVCQDILLCIDLIQHYNHGVLGQVGSKHIGLIGKLVGLLVHIEPGLFRQLAPP